MSSDVGLIQHRTMILKTREITKENPMIVLAFLLGSNFQLAAQGGPGRWFQQAEETEIQNSKL